MSVASSPTIRIPAAQPAASSTSSAASSASAASSVPTARSRDAQWESAFSKVIPDQGPSLIEVGDQRVSLSAAKSALDQALNSRLFMALAAFGAVFVVLFWVKPPMVCETRKDDMFKKRFRVHKALCWAGFAGLVVLFKPVIFSACRTAVNSATVLMPSEGPGASRGISTKPRVR